MSASSEIKNKDGIVDNNDISDFLTPELCEDAGIIVIEIEEDTLMLGAMNLAYIKVKEVINTIESKFNLKVSLKQITSLEWETWFENTHSVSVESIQRKITKDTYEEKNDVIENLEAENLISEQYEDAKNIENDQLSDFDDSLEEESNELA